MENKSRNKIGVALKVAIVFIAVGYIAWRFVGMKNNYFSPEEMVAGIAIHLSVFSCVLLLMPINWLLESYKWKLVASTKIKISMKQAIEGVLAGVTIGTATPNRVGEFAGRIFMIKNGNRVELLQLSFISSFCQVFVTIVFGFVGFMGMIFSNADCEREFPFLFLMFSGLFFCTLPLWINLLPISWKNKISVIIDFSRKKFIQALFISSVRYLVYAGQFLLLFSIFNSHHPHPFENDYFSLPQIFFLVTISYFIATMIPTFSFTEVFVRGTIAGTVFTAYDGTSSGFIFSTAFGVAVLLWIINVAIPSLIGTLFIFKLKFFKSGK